MHKKCYTLVVNSRYIFGVDFGGVVVGVDFGLGGNGDLILWLISGTSEELVINTMEHSCNTS